jgi:hypothetical protein
MPFTQSKPEENKNDVKKDEGKKEEGKREEIKREESISLNKIKPYDAKNLDEQTTKALMKKPIEEVINKWKKKLDEQTIAFSETGEKLKTFENIFNKNFEHVINIILFK